ncbi:MAG: helix-turn-helix domain-containing protein [Candidatus Ventricola sp.]
MNAKQAVAARILELCKQRGIAINALANSAGISPSTIYSILNTKSMNPGIVTIKQICDGIDISLREFFDSPVFENLEQEIR